MLVSLKAAPTHYIGYGRTSAQLFYRNFMLPANRPSVSSRGRLPRGKCFLPTGGRGRERRVFAIILVV